MLYAIVGSNNSYSPMSAKELEHIDFSQLLKDSSKEEGEARKEILRTKVRTVARLTRIFKNLRENSEMLVAIKKMAPDGKIPRGLLMNGRPAIRDILREFEHSKEIDKENEKHPFSATGSPVVINPS